MMPGSVRHYVLRRNWRRVELSPDLPVICLIGDGCFQMTCGEVATAKRLGLTLPIVALDSVDQVDRSGASSRSTAPRCRRRSTASRRRIIYFGVPAIGVRSADALETAVTKALAA